MQDSNHLDIQHDGKPFCGHGNAKLVRWSDGGYVKWQCGTCSESALLTESEFQAIEHDERCSKCGNLMHKDMLAYRTYGFRCGNYDSEIKFGELLPGAVR